MKEKLDALLNHLANAKQTCLEDGNSFEAAEFGRALEMARGLKNLLPPMSPWSRFLDARGDVIDAFAKADTSWRTIAHEVSADEQQVRRIHENSEKAEKLAVERECPKCHKKTRVPASPFNCSCGFRWNDMVLRGEPGRQGATYYGKDGPVAFDPDADLAEYKSNIVDVARKILTVYEAFPEDLKKLTAEEILVQIRKIVGFDT